MAKPRVVLAVDTFPASTQPYVIDRFVRLRDLGWNTCVVCTQFDAAEWDRVPVLASHPKLRKRITVTETINLSQTIAAQAPQLVHVEFGYLAPPLMHLGQDLDCGLVVSLQSYDSPLISHHKRYRSVWREADAIHTVSQALWQAVLRAGCPVEKRHAVIPPGIDAAFFDPGARRHREVIRASRPLRVLSVGRLHWSKGYDYGLQAIGHLRDQGIPCEYRIIGRGELRTAVDYTILDLQLQDSVTMLGACSSDQVRAELAWADVLLHPAISEAFGIATLEAQAMMIPVVCTNANGLPEAVADGRTGLVVPRRDPFALATALAWFAGNPQQRQQFGETGRQRVEAQFRPETAVNQFISLYHQVLGRSETRER